MRSDRWMKRLCILNWKSQTQKLPSLDKLIFAKTFLSTIRMCATANTDILYQNNEELSVQSSTLFLCLLAGEGMKKRKSSDIHIRFFWRVLSKIHMRWLGLPLAEVLFLFYLLCEPAWFRNSGTNDSFWQNARWENGSYLPWLDVIPAWLFWQSARWDWT